MKRLRARAHGRVQGVFFRASTRSEARRLQLSGWVRNCPDGSVELLAEGPADRLGQLLAWCEAGGPPGARVDRVDREWGPATAEFEGFDVRY